MSGHDVLKDIILGVAFDVDDEMTPSETVTYTKKDTTTRPIQVIANREQPETNGAANKPLISVTVANDSTNGIAYSELILNADTITIPEWPGETGKARLIKKIRTKNAAFMRLELT
jgi:hypothetical protein